jgi:hypothetical protein
MAKPQGINPAYRLAVASRIVAAVGGGYALTSLLTIAVSVLLPLAGINQAQSVFAMTSASFVVYAVVIMAVFHARTATRAWLWLLGTGLPLGLVAAVLSGRGPG